MIYDHIIEEYYPSTKREMNEAAIIDSWPSCLRCAIQKPEHKGFYLSTGEFVCYACKADALQSSTIYLCLDCSDYYLTPLNSITPEYCPRCTPKTIQVHP